MAGPQNSPKSFGFPVPDHYSTRNQHQSNEKINVNTSTQFRKTTTDRGWDAAREGGDPKFMIQSTTNLKKSMERERRRWRTHQNEEERLNSTASLDDEQQQILGFPTSYAQFHLIWLGI
jgi:hypothetical protein